MALEIKQLAVGWQMPDMPEPIKCLREQIITVFLVKTLLILIFTCALIQSMNLCPKILNVELHYLSPTLELNKNVRNTSARFGLEQ